ncbi:unnamed protein product [Paramecium sonneborni]|uniref:RBR-type E3 ubiquitin transferase n=1 Tax=Paramecium sonneborni TaxID=65129 RepID=A0A8S1PFH3_9CILI|nr:unnamed protein product [Paramecium sonneborni]
MQKDIIIENNKIQSFIDVIVDDLSEALQISKADSIFILHKIEWDEMKIGDLFLKNNNVNQILNNLGLSQKIQSSEMNESILCPICFNNNTNVQLSCNHQCCSICLNLYVEEQLRNTIFPKCFQNQCDKILPTDFYSNMNQFKSWIIKSVQNNKKKCGNNKCQELIPNSLKTYTIKCICGFINCSICKNGDHRPLSCAQASKLRFNQTQCPKCQITIEKFGGCNKMICKTQLGCGYQFCWSCLEPWKQNHQCIQKQENKVKQLIPYFSSQFIRKKQANTIPLFSKKKFLDQFQNPQDREIIENCFNFINVTDDLNTKEVIFFAKSNLNRMQFHESLQYERLMHYKKEIENIIQKKQKSENTISQLQKYCQVAKEFLEDYLDQFNQEQSILQ